MNYSHEPVLLKETLNNLIYDKSGSYLDCTFGLGGHSKKILENLNSDGRLYSIDKDKEVVLFCAGGVRSEMSVKSLTAKGLKNISHIEGGFGSMSNSSFKIV